MKRLAEWVGSCLLAAQLAHGAEPWTLERALDQALASPDARLAQLRIRAAEATLEQADSAFWPHFQMQASYTRTDNPMRVFGSILNQRAYQPSLNFNQVPDVDDLNLRGMVMMPLYTGGQRRAGRDAAQAGAAASRHRSDSVRNALAFEVVRAFQNVLKTRQFINATVAATNAFSQNLIVARKRLEGGTLLKSEVLDLEVRLAQAREDLVRARNANTLATLALRDLLGLEEVDFIVADTAPEVRAPVAEDSSARPELAAARERVRAAEAGVRVAQGGHLPRLNAFGSLDHDSGWVTGGDGNTYTAGLTLQWDLWDGLLTRGKTREARADLESAREEQRKLRLALDLEVEQARLDLTAAAERLEVTEKSVDQAEESVTLTRDRFEQGLAISTQLIDAESALTAARVHRAEAASDQRIAIAALRKALALPQLDFQPTRR